jgi:hypothetical protein
MKKPIKLAILLTLSILIVLYITTLTQNNSINIERETEYLGPNSDTSSLSNEEIKFE